jgi:hypothetical protein
LDALRWVVAEGSSGEYERKDSMPSRQLATAVVQAVRIREFPGRNPVKGSITKEKEKPEGLAITLKSSIHGIISSIIIPRAARSIIPWEMPFL